MNRLSPFVTIALALAFQVFTAANASAVQQGISARTVCVADTLGIEVTVTTNATIGYVNNNTFIRFNSVTVGGPYSLAQNADLVVSFPAPSPGTSVAVSAVVGEWTPPIPGEAGESVATTIVVEDLDCDPSTPGVGRFTGGGKSIDFASGLKVTKGFTIHCDLILSNNLEINWPVTGGKGMNQFHMLQHTSANCFDDGEIEQRPPAAPVDTIIGVGTGRFNGVDGYTVTFTLVDAGEPGTADRIGFVITAPGGGVVLNLPVQNITGGNVQAHYDQPHKNKP